MCRFGCFFFSSRRRHTRCALVTGVQTCALPISSSLSGPNDPVVIPRGSEKTDWEVELAAVIGKPASYVEEKDALAHVAGYLICNDVSERAFQIERGSQWDKGKRSEERRVGKEGVSTCRSRWRPDHKKKKKR